MKRHIDLNTHSNYSPWETVITPREILDFAIKDGRKAVAITDLNNVGAFAEFSWAVKREENIKPIYGVRLHCKEKGLDNKPFLITLLAKNQAGLKNMYKIISSSYMQIIDEEQWPCTPWDDVLENRKGLLLGLECRWAYLYQGLTCGHSEVEFFEDIAYRLKEADYVEVRPWDQNRFQQKFGWGVDEDKLKEKAMAVIDYLQDLGKLPVAVSNGNCITREDELCMKILNKNREGKKCNPVNYLKSTEDVLKKYSFLGEKLAKALVLDNPNQIVNAVEIVEPIKIGSRSINLPNAEEGLKGICYQVAHGKYGEILPELIETRLADELQMIFRADVAGDYFLAAKVVQKCNDLGMCHNARGSAGSSLVAFLTGITKANPLPPHYYCPACKRVDFVDEKKYPSGFDLFCLEEEKKKCPSCGAQRSGDGHNLPREFFMGLHGDRPPYFELDVPEEAWDEIQKYISEIFGEEKTVMAGAAKKLFWRGRGMVDAFFREEYISISEDKKQHLTSRIDNVGNGVNRLGMRMLVIPKNGDVFDYTPLQYRDPSEIRAGKKPLTQIDGYDLELGGISILNDPVLSMLNMIEKHTRISLDRTKLEWIDIHCFFKCGSNHGLPYKMIWKIKEASLAFPVRFSDIIKAYGLAHGIGTWTENAQEILRRGLPLEDTIAHREDAMVTLLHHGMSREKAFAIAENIRKGKGLHREQILELKDHELPHWYIESMEKIRYLLPKAHAVEHVINYLRLIWYKIQLPAEFYAAVLSYHIAPLLDYRILTEGKERLRMEVDRINEERGKEDEPLEWSDYDLPDIEKAVLEIAIECYEEGISFLPADVNNSDAEKFVSDGWDIYIPLRCWG
jgi:DNA polymerase-3 subunit alpha (Gram-positive type)